MEVDDGHDAAICKYCGTAFVVEKAINDYNVNHMDNIQSGRNAINTGYVDQSDQYILMARRYKYSGNAEKYYTLALIGWPDNWEANFYSIYYAVMRAIVGILYCFGDQLEVHFPSSQAIMEIAADRWKYALSIRKRFAADHPRYCKTGNGDSRKSVQAETDHFACKVKAFDPAFKAPRAAGYYIATCVYGSYDCPQVWTLKRFRDYTLKETWYGRAFIRCYYAISPLLVKWFGGAGHQPVANRPPVQTEPLTNRGRQTKHMKRQKID